ncbi:MAG: radical SAM protein, partial [bacterium]
FLDENEGIFWAKRSIDFAFDVGVACCAIIPTRAGNGALDALQKQELFHEPRLDSLEEVLDYGISLQRGRVFADLWDLERFSDCEKCFEKRRARLYEMNLLQTRLPAIRCTCTPFHT